MVSSGHIKTVARYYKWTPHVIQDLYCDDRDHLGLIFWYNDCLEQKQQLDNLNKKK